MTTAVQSGKEMSLISQMLREMLPSTLSAGFQTIQSCKSLMYRCGRDELIDLQVGMTLLKAELQNLDDK